MKKHMSLKILTGVVLLVVGYLISSNQSSGTEKEASTDPNNFNEAIASQFNDNIRDVAARLQQTEKKISRLEKENQKLTQQNEQLAQERGQTEEQSGNSGSWQSAIDTLKQELNQLKERASQYPDSFQTAEQSERAASSHQGIKDIDALRNKVGESIGELSQWQNAQLKESQTKVDAPEEIPYYTIPAGSDLGQTTLISALIGEVPVDGKVAQPLFPFTAIVSRGEMIAANGVDLPEEITGMKVMGYSLGVGSFLDNISCVRAYVTSALFVFEDGHFVSVGNEEHMSSVEMINNNALGYLTNRYGNPCIKGQYTTNAPQVLTAMLASGGVQGFGNSLSEWQTSTTSNSNGVTTSPTGSAVRYALGGGVSQGSIKAADWLEKRITGSFDVVYVPASLRMADGRYRPNRLNLHLTKTINIDKSINGRKLNYGQAQQQIFDFNLR